MATAAPHVKLLRQLASAKDDYLSGAFDISWDGAKATLYLVFGRPSHAVFETDQAQIEGEAAIDALLAALPRNFVVSDWRRAMSPQETLSITIDELAGPFVRLAGSYADDPVVEEDPEWWSSADDSPDLAFGLADFPLLPGGRPLWAETSPENVHLADQLAELPPSILILTGAKLRAAAVVSGGDLIDAVWIDDADVARGETAGMALLGATKGSLAGYALDDPRVAEALTMLWRLPVAVSGIELSWLDPASMLAAFRGDGLDRVLVIDAPVRGIALFSRGGLVAVYSETQRSAVASPERLRSLLSQARGRLTVMERKPRPVAAESEQAPVSATEFFHVAPAETDPEAASSELPVTADAELVATHAEVVLAPDAPEAAVGAEQGAFPDAEHEAEHESATEEAPEATQGPAADAAAHVGDETLPEVAPHDWSEIAPPADDSETASTPTSETVAADEGPAAEFETISDHGEPPPPPPPDDAFAAPELPPPPPAPVAAEPTPKAKRRRFGFGRKHKDRGAAQSTPTAEDIAADAAADAAEAATFAGWSVRQPSAEPQPVWLRSRDGVDEPAATPAEGTEAPGVVATPDHDATPAYGYRVHADEPAAGAPPPDDADATSSADEPAPVTASASDAVEAATAPADVWHYQETVVPVGQPPDVAREAHDDWSSSSWLDDAVSDASNDPQAAEASTGTPSADEHDDATPEVETHEVETHVDMFVAGAEPVEAAAEPKGEPSNWSPFSWSTRRPEHDQTRAASGDVDTPATTGDAAEAPGASVRQAPTDDEQAAEPADGHEQIAASSEVDHDQIAATSDADHDQIAATSEADHEFAAAESEAHAPEPAMSEPDAAVSDAEESEADEEVLPPRKPGPTLRTPGPWSWPLAEHDDDTSVAADRSYPGVPEGSDDVNASDDEEAFTLEPATVGATPHETAATAERNGEQGFFNRDEPVGSQYVDFDEVRSDLVQIGVVWLGEENAVPVTKLLLTTRSTIDDFVATIDTIRGLHIQGQDPASIQAMAREMHQQAAERLCGA
jgi:hypothetical protein